MVYKTYLDKFNTIMSDSEVSVGLSPVEFMYYGGGISRALVHFSLSKLTNLVNGKVVPDTSKLTHRLKIYTSGAIEYNGKWNTEYINNVSDAGTMLRAGNCSMILFKLPEPFESGNGYDYKKPIAGISALATNGANWYNASTGKKWISGNGVYTTDYLSRELDKFIDGEKSIIIATQDFTVGNEILDVDITDYVNALLAGEEENNGIGIAFTPTLEWMELDDTTRYISFFTHETHTFFEPYLESRYDDVINDGRNDFYQGKTNRLYLYCNIGGELNNLDEMPTCSIDGVGEFEVKQATKGVYFIEVDGKTSKELAAGVMFYDTWSNLKFNGADLDDVEMDFVVKPYKNFFNLGNEITHREKYIPELYGIKDSEIIKRGDVRKLNFVARVPFTRNQFALIDNMELRLYVKDGLQEFDVIPYDRINKAFAENYYTIDTNELVPEKYYIDVKVTTDGCTIIHHDLVHFSIENNITNKSI